MKRLVLILLVLLAVLAVACGGGGGTPTATPDAERFVPEVACALEHNQALRTLTEQVLPDDQLRVEAVDAEGTVTFHNLRTDNRFKLKQEWTQHGGSAVWIYIDTTAVSPPEKAAFAAVKPREGMVGRVNFFECVPGYYRPSGSRELLVPQVRLHLQLPFDAYCDQFPDLVDADPIAEGKTVSETFYRVLGIDPCRARPAAVLPD